MCLLLIIVYWLFGSVMCVFVVLIWNSVVVSDSLLFSMFYFVLSLMLWFFFGES